MNVLLITVDCLRHDKLGCSGGGSELTPNIDRFSQGASVFTQAIAQGYSTWVSFGSLFASIYPYFQPGASGRKPILAGRPTLPAILRQNGFATGAFHSNPWLSTYFGYGQEYDVYQDNLLPTAIHSRSHTALRLAQVRHLVSPYLAGDQVTAQAVAWIQQQRSPFFAWIHYMDAHGPYRAQRRLPAWAGHILGWRLYHKAQEQPEAITAAEHKALLNRYMGGIRFVDRVWGTLQAQLESSGTLADTLVIITADHGEAFGEHKSYAHGYRHPYDEVIRVPLIVRWPGRTTVPRVDGQVELTSMVPTVLDLLGLPIPAHAVGRSVVPWLRGKVPPEEPVNAEAFSIGTLHARYAAVSVRTPEWKYILRRSMTQGTQETELYHLATDPGERTECGDRYPEAMARLAEITDAKVHRVLTDAEPDAEEEELPDEVVSRLRALGYMD